MEVRVKFDAALWFVCALCAVIATLALLMAYPAIWPWLGVNSSNIASWVQAIGSILTIYFGFKVAQFTIEEGEKRQERRDAESVRQKLRKCFFLVADVCFQLNFCVEYIHKNIDSSDVNWDFYVLRIEDVMSRISALTPDNYPEVIYVMEMTSLRVQLENCLFLMKKGPVEDKDALALIKNEFLRLAKQSQSILREMLQGAKKYSTQGEIDLVDAYRKNRIDEDNLDMN